MKKSMILKLFIFVITPYVVGVIIDWLLSYGVTLNSSLFWSFSSMILYSWQLGSVFFWFIVGKQFGSLKINKMKSIILGNLVWGISFMLFIWQFLLVKDINANRLLVLIPQHYVLGFIGWSSKLISLFSSSISGSSIFLLAHTMMIIIFILGFKSASSS